MIDVVVYKRPACAGIGDEGRYLTKQMKAINVILNCQRGEGMTMGVNTRLTDASESVWAKSVFRGDPNDHRYLLLWQHLRDCAAVARRIWNDFLPDAVKEDLIADLGGERAAVGLASFLAMVHDVGKASPAFEVQCDYLCDRVRERGLRVDAQFFACHGQERAKYRHELVGYQSVCQWFSRRGYRTDEGSMANGIAYIIGSHHGTCVTGNKKRLLGKVEAKHYLGGQEWEDVRQDIIDWAAEETDFETTLRLLNGYPLRCRTQILLTSIVIIADWIASDGWLFPLNSSEIDEQCFDSCVRARRAWRQLNLPRPWQVSLKETPVDELFADRFDIPGAHLRPVQAEAVRLAQTMPSPGLMIIEANMGEGKTEAALLAAEVLAGRFGCGGVYYALPTQTTANAMFHRALGWIGRLPAPEQGTLGSVFLSHGKREQNEEYFNLTERALDVDASMMRNDEYIVDDEDQPSGGAASNGFEPSVEAVVNSWLSGRKRGNLADFVLGTIDQVLMMSLQCKHVVLRHLAFAGKVVILDEVHSNTAYMNVYLETTLSWLGAYGTPVIMLSATLPQARREAFLEAYRRGAATQTAMPHEQDVREQGLADFLAARETAIEAEASSKSQQNPSAESEIAQSCEQAQDTRYPLISYVSGEERPQAIAAQPSGRESTVLVQRIADDDETLVRLLRDKLAAGGCAAVVRDTVQRAQHTYDVLNDAFGDVMDVSLDHARYMACDRSAIDTRLLERFGKDSTPATRQGIVVATQVVEQSLDVDFDVMVTDIAPADLILQRAGRLHRHRRGEGEGDRPEPLRRAQLYISGMEACDIGQPPIFAKSIESVYERFFLMRTAALMGLCGTEPIRLHLPQDIPQLVQGVYDVDHDCCPDAWRSNERDARGKLCARVWNSREKAAQFRIFRPDESRSPYSLGDWLEKCMPDPEAAHDRTSRQARASVRDSDDSFEVLLLQKDQEGNLCLPAWVDDSPQRVLAHGFELLTAEQIRAVLACSITLGGASLCWQSLDAAIAFLESPQNVPEEWFALMQQHHELNGQLPIVLDTAGNAVIHVYDRKNNVNKKILIHYSIEKGWEAHVED